MSVLEYRIDIRDGRSVSGAVDDPKGAVHIVESLPRGHLTAVTAWFHLDTAEDERIFMNGYQTWTFCPEYTRADKIRGLSHLPKAGVKYFGLDRYGDYHFVPYPERAGLTHGESWCYFRRGEQFRLIASLNERPGYTLFEYDASIGLLTLRRDCAGMSCGGEFHAFDLFFAEGSEDEVFDAWFTAMDVRPRTQERIAGYSSWYNRYQKINDASISADLKGCAEVLSKGDLFQIDDGWERAVGDWLEPDEKKFPRGMKASAEDIHAKGFKAGLWLAPFVCQRGSQIMSRHPDWLLKQEGKSVYCGCNWGGFWSLDIDNPEFAEYLKSVFRRVFDEWGFDLVKLDFLYGAAPFGTEKESRAGRMIRAMELLRELCGDKLILGCGVPVMPAFGLVDYCRVGCDVGLDWNDNRLMQQIHRERVSTRQAILNSLFRRELNGRAYLSDPDVFFLREDNIRLTAKEKDVLAAVNSLFGGVLLCSDDMARYSAETREKYAQLLRNRDARHVRVHADEGIAVSYELDGETHTVVIE